MVNHLSLSREGSTADGTSPLHSCAVMKFSGQVSPDHYYESARVLMLAGGNPYQENSSGGVPLLTGMPLFLSKPGGALSQFWYGGKSDGEGRDWEGSDSTS